MSSLTMKFALLVFSINFLLLLNVAIRYNNYYYKKNDGIIERSKEVKAVSEEKAEIQRENEFIETNTKIYIPSKSVMLDKEIYNILIWTPRYCYGCAPFNRLKDGNIIFKNQQCKYTNCYITENKNVLASVKYFDAILFNGRQVIKMDNHSELPQKRSLRQRYVFVQLESADRFPVCNKIYDDFFNWTVTYRLSSNIPWPYLGIRDVKNLTVGPKIDMEWIENMEPVTEDVKRILNKKSKTAAWFVSNCRTRSERENFVDKLRLKLKGLSGKDGHIDQYGRCGNLQCSRTNSEQCNNYLEKHYFFYLSLENSFDEDYVTEKLLTALQHYTVPVVFGGADYSRFLPPGSYLDGRQLNIDELATAMLDAINNRTRYYEFFRWHNHYTYSDMYLSFVCDLCEKLNKDNLPSTYPKFRYWWNKDFVRQCLQEPKWF